MQTAGVMLLNHKPLLLFAGDFSGRFTGLFEIAFVFVFFQWHDALHFRSRKDGAMGKLSGN
jgi:hypothetical protein